MSKYVTTGQDWSTVTLGQRPPSNGGGRVASIGGGAPRMQNGDSKFVTRSGPHQAAGGRTVNQQHNSGSTNHKKLDEDNENYKHKTVSHNFCLTLQRARQQKGWSQKDLAHNTQEREQIIKEYENGKALPNNTVISKMERALGIHLRGKEAGKEIQKPVKKSDKPAAKPAGKKSKAKN